MHRSRLARGRVLSVWYWIKFFAPVAVLFAGLGVAQAATITVNNEAELRTAVDVANSSGGNTIILVSDGVYTLTDTL